MFGLRKRAAATYDDRLIEHTLGYVLTCRGDIIPNSVFLDKEHELNGMIGFNAAKLSDELDYIALQYTYKFFIEKSVSVEKLDHALSDVFDRLVKEKVIAREERELHYELMTARVHEYLNTKSAAKIGMIFMRHVVEGHNALTSDTGRYVAPVLKTLESDLHRRIDAELAV